MPTTKTLILKENVKVMLEKSSKFFEKLDKFISLYEEQRQEMLFFGAQLRRVEERIGKLEVKQSRR